MNSTYTYFGTQSIYTNCPTCPIIVSNESKSPKVIITETKKEKNDRIANENRIRLEMSRRTGRKLKY